VTQDEIDVCSRLNRVLWHLEAENEQSQDLTFEPCINRLGRPDHHFIIKLKHSRTEASVRVGMHGQGVLVSLNSNERLIDSFESMNDANRVIEIVKDYIAKLKAIK